MQNASKRPLASVNDLEGVSKKIKPRVEKISSDGMEQEGEGLGPEAVPSSGQSPKGTVVQRELEDAELADSDASSDDQQGKALCSFALWL